MHRYQDAQVNSINEEEKEKEALLLKEMVD